MRRILMACLLGTASAAAWAQSDAFPFGDPTVGRQVLEAKCTACHVKRFGGDGSAVFQRTPRKPSSAASLLAWVQRCNEASKAGLSREDEESVAAYLNGTYYRFR